MPTLFSNVANLSDAMAFHRRRHAVLAGNVANVDTPGYRARDLAAANLVADPGALALSRTDAGHIGTGRLAPGVVTVEDNATPVTTLDQNTVSLENELAKIDANRVRFAGTAELVSRRLALLRYASTDGMG